MILLSQCTPKPGKIEIIRIKGSDTMRSLSELLAQEYMKKRESVSIYVEGGGTAKGAEAISRGWADICTASRTLDAAESKLIAENFGAVGMSYLVAKDALSIYVHPKNIVDVISMQQLKEIYQCKKSNWIDFGGKNSKIVVVNRSPNSGTQSYFKQHVLEGEGFCSTTIIKHSYESIEKTVLENEDAICYGGFGTGNQLKTIRVDGIAPTSENIRNDRYPIIRYLYFYTVNTPRGELKRFIDWTLSSDGQRIVRQAGFIPIWEISF